MNVVVKFEFFLCPIALIGMIANGKIKMPVSLRNRMTHQLMQMDDAWSEPPERTVSMAGEYVIIAATELQPETRRYTRGSNVKSANVRHPFSPRGNGTIKIRVTGLLKQVADSVLSK